MVPGATPGLGGSVPRASAVCFLPASYLRVISQMRTLRLREASVPARRALAENPVQVFLPHLAAPSLVTSGLALRGPDGQLVVIFPAFYRQGPVDPWLDHISPRPTLSSGYPFWASVFPSPQSGVGLGSFGAFLSTGTEDHCLGFARD